MLSRLAPGTPRFRFTFALLQFLVVCGMFLIFLQTFELNGDPRSTLAKMMAGTADRPFVYRVLVPFVIRQISTWTSLPANAAALGVMWLSLAGFALAFRILCKRFVSEPILAETAVLLGLVGLYFSFYFGKIYDSTILCLFTLELVLMESRQWRAYMLIFPIACLVKETTALLGLVFALHFFRILERRTFWSLLAGQAGVFLVIRLVITWVFRNNPGNALEFHLPDHIKAFQSQPIFFSLWLLLLVLVAAATAYGWRRKPLFLRHAALATALPLLVLFFSSGGPYELRNLYEAYPAVFLLCFFTLQLGLGTSTAGSS